MMDSLPSIKSETYFSILKWKVRGYGSLDLSEYYEEWFDLPDDAEHLRIYEITEHGIWIFWRVYVGTE